MKFKALICALAMVSTGGQAEDYQLRKTMEAISAQRWMCEQQEAGSQNLERCEKILQQLIAEGNQHFNRDLKQRFQLTESVLTPEARKEHEQDVMAWVAENRKCEESGTDPEQCKQQSEAGLKHLVKANSKRINDLMPEEHKNKPVLAIDQIRGSSMSGLNGVDIGYIEQKRRHNEMMEQQQRHHNERMQMEQRKLQFFRGY